MEKQKLTQLFNEPKIIGLIGDPNSGKSNAIYHIAESLLESFSFNLYTFGLRNKIEGAKEIFSINELENLRDSVIILDEFFSLFDLDDRKKKNQIENTLRLIHHNNNILLLCGLPENFKKFISAKLNVVIFKQCTLAEFINGSAVKRICMDYSGYEKGSAILRLYKDQMLIYDGRTYSKHNVPYLLKYDSKKENTPIFKEKEDENVQKKSG